MTASASRPPNFTFPSLPVRQRVFISRRNAGKSLPARQPYLFHPTADLPFSLYLSDTASLDLPSDAGESLPARQLYLFKPVAQRGLPVRHGDLETTVGRRQEPPRQQPYLFLLDEAYPSDTATLKPVGRRREPTGQSNLSFSFCGRQSLPNCCWLTVRPSDNLTLPFRLNLSTR